MKGNHRVSLWGVNVKLCKLRHRKSLLCIAEEGLEIGFSERRESSRR